MLLLIWLSPVVTPRVRGVSLQPDSQGGMAGHQSSIGVERIVEARRQVIAGCVAGGDCDFIHCSSETMGGDRWGYGVPAILEGVLGGHRGTGAPQMGVGEVDRLSGKLVREDIAGWMP